MPMYEFQCTKCAKEFEALQSYKEPNPPCPGCAGWDTRRLISATNVQFKGEGWTPKFYPKGKEFLR